MKKVIIIAGPTACGKTSCSIELAKEIDGEIISADSMQVYKFMNIGTAKVKKEEMQGIKHYLIDEFYPDEDFSIAVFQKLTKKYIEEIHNKGKVPIIVGGTGFYINSILFDNDFRGIEKDEKLRAKLEYLAKNKGSEYLHLKLKSVDFTSYEKIHPNNVKKIIRALEFYYQTGKTISEHNNLEKQRKLLYPNSFFILNLERSLLYEKINFRVDEMIKEGLVNEVKSLLEKGYKKSLTSMQGIGYKEIIKYIDGEISLDYAINLIKKNTRHLAKRQITWFKHQCEGTWIDVYNKDIFLIVENIKKSIGFK